MILLANAPLLAQISAMTMTPKPEQIEAAKNLLWIANQIDGTGTANGLRAIAAAPETITPRLLREFAEPLDGTGTSDKLELIARLLA